MSFDQKLSPSQSTSAKGNPPSQAGP